MFRRRHAFAAVATVTACTLALAGLVVSAGPAAGDVGTDRTDIARLEQEIAAQGEHVQSLVTRFNEAQARVDAIDAQMAHARRRLDADRSVEAAATASLRRVAIKAYVSGAGMDSPTLQMFSGTSSLNTMLEQNQYLGAVNARLDDALTALHIDQSRTQDAEDILQSEQQQAKKTVAELTSAHRAATAAITADEARLTSVSGNLRSLLAAADARRAAQEAAAERALAGAAARARTPVTAPPSPTTFSPQISSTVPPTDAPTVPPIVITTGPTTSHSGGGYGNPLRAIAALTPERIDQGVDYAGFGPIYAIGDGVVLNTVGSGWPGGTFIAYRLTDGPARGLVVFAAEDIETSVQVGDSVTSQTVIGHMYAGPDGIETGWADGSSLPDTMARTYGQFDGSNSTAFGMNFSGFLQTLGAPGGVPGGSTSGSLPAGWPRW